jgi:hypothetical protein
MTTYYCRTFGARNHCATAVHDLPVVAINSRPFGASGHMLAWSSRIDFL